MIGEDEREARRVLWIVLSGFAIGMLYLLAIVAFGM